MWRILLYVVKVALLVGAAIWIADRPGAVSLEWLGYRVDTSVGVLVAAVVLAVVAGALVYRLWRLIVRAPRQAGRLMETGRRRRGYKALSHGMVAVAAGDAAEARRFARKADQLLDEPPLTMLLAAQAAQLEGDEAAARRYFEKMLEAPDTRFLGLRGLIMQNLRAGNDAAALAYAREAQRLRPKTPWVLTTLFQLEQKTGNYERALIALHEAEKRKAMPTDLAKRNRAVTLLEEAESKSRQGAAGEALKLARAAVKANPALPATTAAVARLAIDAGKPAEAVKQIERNWARAPHPELMALYLEARSGLGGIDRVRAVTKLVNAAHDHTESRIALAESTLAASLWGETRRHLKALLDAAPSSGADARVYRLMAAVEEAENRDAAKARAWLVKASQHPSAAWVCESCGAAQPRWRASCGSCRAFATLTWSLPKQVSELPTSPIEAAALMPSSARSPDGEDQPAKQTTTPAKVEPAAALP